MSSNPKMLFEKIVFPNGLQLILHLDRKLPIVHVNEWFHVGSKNERPGRTGFAHLFEHIMFQGSKNAPNDYFSFVERAGANLREGGVNGTTDFDRTNYFATVPSGNLEFLLWLESDRLATLADALTQENLDNQREVVRNERRQSLENVPYGKAFMMITENLHPTGHPYSWDVIGSHEDLIAASLDDVKGFFHRYYTPNNLSLTIAGDFDPEDAARLVEKYYGSIPPGPSLERPARWVPFLDGEKIIEVRDRIPQERAYIIWPAVPYFEPEDANLDIASRVLSDGLSSRLNRALVYDEQLCSDVSAFNQSLEISGSFGIVATARPGASLATIERRIDELVAELAAKGPTKAELDRVKTKWEFEFVSGLERIGGFGGKADILNRYNTFLGDPTMLDKDVSRYREATTEGVRDAVAHLVDNRNRLAVRYRPESSQQSSTTPLDRSTSPPLGADRIFVAPEVSSETLPNGLSLFLVNRSELPKVAVTIATRAGCVGDPAGLEGLAQMTVKTIDMGIASMNALEIEEAFGDLGVSLGGAAGREYATLGFEVLRKNLEPALALFASVVRSPTYPADDVARELQLQLDALGQQANDPGSLAGRIRPMIAFGPHHPYGRPASGLPSTIAAISADQLKDFHRHYWRPASSALVIAGDLSMSEAKELVTKAFGSWEGTASQRIDIPPPLPLGEGKVFLVNRPDAAQTIVAQILPGITRKSPDYYRFRLVDAVWGGGGFGTRLNLNLREDKGYSYGVFSSIAAFSGAGAWWASGGIQTDKTREAMIEFVQELEALAGKRTVTEIELEAARTTRIRGYAQQFESLSRIAGQVAELWISEMPLSELQREYDELGRATIGEVTEIAKRYVDPRRVSYLLVGDLAKIEDGIRSLKLGEIVHLDEEGQTLPATI